MATYSTGIPERRAAERRRDFYPAMLRGFEGLRVSWGGVWGGVLVAMGLFLLMTALGVAVARSLETAGFGADVLGIAAGLWMAGSLLAALFVGGVVSTRAGGVVDRTTGFFEGALVWVVSVFLVFLFAASGVSTLAGGMFGLMAAPAAPAGPAPQRLDLASGSVDQILDRLNDPEIRYRLAGTTGIPEAELSIMLDEIESRVEGARGDAERARREARLGAADLYAEARVGAQAQRAPERIEPTASRSAWATFAALVLSLGAAVAGAMAGRRRLVPGRERRAGK